MSPLAQLWHVYAYLRDSDMLHAGLGWHNADTGKPYTAEIIEMAAAHRAQPTAGPMDVEEQFEADKRRIGSAGTAEAMQKFADSLQPPGT